MLDAGVALLECQADAHERAAGAEGGDEVVHRAARLLQDLDRGPLVVGELVVVVGELVRHEVPARELRHQLAGPQDGAVGAEPRRRQGHPGAEGLDHLAPLDRDRLAHDDLDGVALDRADHGQADAGVAAGGLDHRHAGAQRPLALRLLDHGERDPVLDAAGGVEPLQLGQQPDLRVGVQPADLDHRRPADEVEDAPGGGSQGHVHGAVQPGNARRQGPLAPPVDFFSGWSRQHRSRL